MNPDTHFYLYAKNHYIHSVLEKDLCKIMSVRCMIPEDLVDYRGTIDTLLRLTFKHLCESGNPEYFFCEFMKQTVPYDEFWNFSVNKDDSHADRVARACLSVLAFTKVKDLDLGEADSNILPLKEK